MKWPFRKKNKKQLVFQFLCKRCDFFFYREDSNNCRCPNCGSIAEVYDVFEEKIDERLYD